MVMGIVWRCSFKKGRSVTGGGVVLSLSANISSTLTLTCTITSPRISLVKVITSCNGGLLSIYTRGDLGLLRLLNRASIPICGNLPRSDAASDFRIVRISGSVRNGGKVNSIRLPAPGHTVRTRSNISFCVRTTRGCNGSLVVVPANPVAGLTTTLRGSPRVTRLVNGIAFVNNTLAIRNGIASITRTGVGRSTGTTGAILRDSLPLAVINLSIALHALLAGGRARR